jgi:hypothetical protein
MPTYHVAADQLADPETAASTRHAVRVGTTVALCGAEPVHVLDVSWPGQGSAVCRECSRMVAGGPSLNFKRSSRRPGGMS